MQNIIIDKPYEPVAPTRGRIWPMLLRQILPWQLRKQYGIVEVRFEHGERLRQSLDAGHGIIVAPNHCRDEDPLVVGMLTRHLRNPFFIMASWHLFMQSRVQSFFLRRAGAFSIYREGIDRWAINFAIDAIANAERPLVMFAEGHISRTNYQINELMDGVSTIARMAAKRRAKLSPPGKVVVHPVAVEYRFLGDHEAAIRKVLGEIETRMSWRVQEELPLEKRVYKVGEALLTLKELEYVGSPQVGTLDERARRLIEAILVPLEDEWAQSKHDGHLNARVKRLRTAILPEMVKGGIDADERKRRWKHLGDVYLVMQLSHYPPDYVKADPSLARMFETIERFEEDLTDKVRVHGPMSSKITVGEAIEVNPHREGRGEHDPLLEQISTQLRHMLGTAPVSSPRF